MRCEALLYIHSRGVVLFFMALVKIVNHIGRASLARENEAGGSWGQEVHILHVNV